MNEIHEHFFGTEDQAVKDAIKIIPHPSENPLKLLVIFSSLILWALIIVSIVGAIYGLFIGLFLYFTHLVLIARIRGSSVKIGPAQFPEIYSRVVSLSKRIGLETPPDAYLMQSGGILNAFATRFGFRNFIVIYTEMVESCANNPNALDFIIGHELGHLHRGHLNFFWFKALGKCVPFLGSAYSRACEYTCDSYGKFSCKDPSKSLDSLCILACGAKFLPGINKAQLAEQTRDLNSIPMKIAIWTMPHPPIAQRIIAINPALKPKNLKGKGANTFLAVLILILLIGLPIGGFIMAISSIGSGLMKDAIYHKPIDPFQPIDEPAYQSNMEDFTYKPDMEKEADDFPETKMTPEEMETLRKIFTQKNQNESEQHNPENKSEPPLSQTAPPAQEKTK